MIEFFFKGFQPHKAIARQLPDYDLFIMPSFPETLGRVYFEALASGVPVIASKNTGIDGMIEHKVHGYLVDHNSVDNIKDAILDFMALAPEQKMQMRKNAMVFARQFTWDVVLEKYYKVYNVRKST
jgi:glycosyltransferase involved in cell wall biosynthesis